MLDNTHPTLSLRQQCKLLEISRSGLYYQPTGISDDELRLMRAIDEEYTRHPFRGTRGMCDYLQKIGFSSTRYQVRKCYQRMAIASVAPGPHTSTPHPGNPIFPYLLRNLAIKRAHQVLSTDITYIRLDKGFIYLMAIIDWFSRFVLDWEVSISLEADFCIDAVARILQSGLCDIFNVDQGAQFTTPKFTQPLLDHDIRVSMDGRGRALDNVFIERLWRSLKYECVYLQQFAQVAEAKQAIRDYFNFYNYERGHQSLNYQTPYQVYQKSLIEQNRQDWIKQFTQPQHVPEYLRSRDHDLTKGGLKM